MRQGRAPSGATSTENDASHMRLRSSKATTAAAALAARPSRKPAASLSPSRSPSHASAALSSASSLATYSAAASAKRASSASPTTRLQQQQESQSQTHPSDSRHSPDLELTDDLRSDSSPSTSSPTRSEQSGVSDLSAISAASSEQHPDTLDHAEPASGNPRRSVKLPTGRHSVHQHHRHHKRPHQSRFHARTSPLDYETLDRTQNPMRGFFVLFWTAMFAYAVSNAYRNFRSNGLIVSLNLYSLATQQIFDLIVADLIMVGSLSVAVLIQLSVRSGAIQHRTASAMQHVWQAAWFSACLLTIFLKDWPWIQSGSFMIHSCAMLLKQHSYTSYNLELFEKYERLQYLRKDAPERPNSGKVEQPASTASREETKTDGVDTAVLKDSKQELFEEIDQLEAELIKPSVAFPNNITFSNFLDYLLVPSLVYELEYPRTQKFRPLYFIEKAAATFCTFGLLYMSYEHYIYPVLLDMPNATVLDSLMQLLMPFMVCYLLIFYIIFECICNAFAELTLFADREFYSDWWNSTTFDEFARKWNRPVHEFLLRHLYLEGIDTYKMSKNDATLLTFFMSSCMHELVLFAIGKRLRLYLFFLQMFQIPLIYLARIPAVRKQKLLGNVVFWFGMFLGPPMLAVAYLREHYAV